MASILDLVKHYQHAIEKYPNDESKILKCIDKLFNLGVTVQHLQETGVGRTVNALRKEPGNVGQAARALVYKWKVMVAAEESDHDEDQTQTTNYNGYENGKTPEDSDNDVKHKSNQYDKYSKSDVQEEAYSNSQHNGSHSGSKRKYHSSEEEETPSKKSRTVEYNETQQRRSNVQVKKEQSETEHDSHSTSSHSDDTDSEDSESYEENKSSKKTTKPKETDKHRSSSSKHSSSHSSQESLKKRSSSSEKSQKHVERQPKHTHSESRHSSEKSSKDKSNSHKYKKEKDIKKEKSDHKSSHKEKNNTESKEESSEKHRSSSEKHKSSSSSEKTKNHSEKSSSKSEKSSSSHKNKTDKDKHKHSSEKSSSNHKSTEHRSSSRDKHSSSNKEQQKDKSSSSKDKENSHKYDKKQLSSSDTSIKENSSRNKNEKDDHKRSSSSSKEKKSHSSSSHSSKSNKSSSSKSKDSPKKKVKKEHEGSDDGIDCGSGASFAEALGMISPTKPKKKSSLTKDSGHSPNISGSNDDLSPAALLAPSAKLAPLPALEISALPEISPNYKPRPPPRFLPHFTDEDVLSAGISSKNQRTKVYSGNKVLGKIPTLYEMCVLILQEHIDALEYTGGVPYEILKPVVDKATPQQLYMLEHFNPYLMEDTDHLWQKFCEKNFRNKKRQELESWREMFMRCQEEQEHRLKSLTANIKIAQEAKKAPVKQTKMAYVDSVVKPPRSVARKQAQHGTAFAASASPAARVAALAAAPNVLKGGARPAPAPSPAATALNKPKKAPLMQKALQFMRGRKR